MTPKNQTIFLLLIACCLSSQLLGQKKFQQSIGFAYLSVHTQQQRFTYQPYQRQAYEVLTPKRYTSFISVNYYPRFNVKSWSQSGLSIGIPLSISAFAEVSTASSIMRKNQNYLMLSLPLTLEWAWGYRSQRDHLDHGIGLYTHIGPALTMGRGLVGDFTNVNPHAGVGLRLKVSERVGFEIAYAQNFLSVLEVDGSNLYIDLLPPDFEEEYGVYDRRAKDRRGTQMLQISLSFH